MSDLRQSGAIEQDADMVVLLHDYEGDDEARTKFGKLGYHVSDPAYAGHRLSHVHIAASRRGKSNRLIPAWFDGEEMRWTSINQREAT